MFRNLNFWFSILVILVKNSDRISIHCRSTGAPYEVCNSLIPRHGFASPQPKNTNPFRLNVTLYPYMNDEEFVHIELYSEDPSVTFKGFVIQARSLKNQQTVIDGTFVPMDSGRQTKVYNCRLTNANHQGNNTWTHLDNSPKGKVSGFWFPESAQHDRIIFLATIMKDLKTFWVHYLKHPQQQNSQSNSNEDRKEIDESTEDYEEEENVDNENNNASDQSNSNGPNEGLDSSEKNFTNKQKNKTESQEQNDSEKVENEEDIDDGDGKDNADDSNGGGENNVDSSDQSNSAEDGDEKESNEESEDTENGDDESGDNVLNEQSSSNAYDRVVSKSSSSQHSVDIIGEIFSLAFVIFINYRLI
ncbi:hypothetical protein SSS_01560 [Sarcoptes scabiei]|uniref:Reelin domain-containing protein n=1 Tax=Sarcoptes scabiei TaxID=52283 RepID=A0A834VHH9_SARSC|nr:hypothetical protein SSS_01560 [Sarcoptes scabiei]